MSNVPFFRTGERSASSRSQTQKCGRRRRVTQSRSGGGDKNPRKPFIKDTPHTYYYEMVVVGGRKVPGWSPTAQVWGSLLFAVPGQSVRVRSYHSVWNVEYGDSGGGRASTRPKKARERAKGLMRLIAGAAEPATRSGTSAGILGTGRPCARWRP